MAKQKSSEKTLDFNSCAMIVAHPDDETLWAGGTILLHPQVRWSIVTLCRRDDRERAAKFFKAVEYLGARGEMGGLDDGPQQKPLDEQEIEDTIMKLLPSGSIDLIITHSLLGEYTRHKRHEETAKAVCRLWKGGRLSAGQMWMFAYEDDGGKKMPEAIGDADLKIELSEKIWRKKYRIITEVYGFGIDSFEAKTTPRREAFWCFAAADDAERRLLNRSKER